MALTPSAPAAAAATSDTNEDAWADIRPPQIAGILKKVAILI